MTQMQPFFYCYDTECLMHIPVETFPTTS